MKHLGIALVIVLVLSAFAFANPFVDVPSDHWAYDAVQSLSAKGIIVGYPDGTFGGNKTMTRYEFAEAVAKALAYVEQKGYVTKDDLAVLEKLSIEFAEELSSLGVTVDDLKAALGVNTKAIAALQETVAKHEKYFEPMLVTGEFDASYSAQVLPTWANGTLSDSTSLNFSVDINDTTNAGVELTVNDVISGAPVVSADAFWINWDDGESYLKISDDIDGIGDMGEMALIYDDDEDNDYAGIASKWSWLDATWRFVGNVDNWYTVNADWGDLGATFSYDPAANDMFVGADLSWKFIDTEDTAATLKVEGGYAITGADFGVAGEVDVATGDLGITLDGHYIGAGFAPTAGSFAPDTIGFGAEVTYPVADDLALDVSYTYETTSGALTTNEVAASLDYTVDADAGEVANLDFTYDMVVSGFVLYVDYLNYPAFDKTKLSAGYQYSSATAEHAAKATFEYAFDSTFTGKLEGRLDTVPTAGAPIWSVGVEFDKTLAENTTLTLGYEHNTWSQDLGDYDDSEMGNIDDNAGTVSMELNVTF